MNSPIRQLAGCGLALSLGLGSLAAPATAVQFPDGTVRFNNPPRLEDSVTTYNATYVWNATYYFTLRLLEEAGEPLQRIEISLREGTDNRMRFEQDETRAFLGTRQNRGERVPIAETRLDEDTQTVSVTFAEPIPPGETVTVGLRPVRTPRYSGIYLFGVTAFPAGEKIDGQFLGFARFHFDRDGGDWR